MLQSHGIFSAHLLVSRSRVDTHYVCILLVGIYCIWTVDTDSIQLPSDRTRVTARQHQSKFDLPRSYIKAAANPRKSSGICATVELKIPSGRLAFNIYESKKIRGLL